MHIANVGEAKANLSKLIQQALAGNEVVIAKHGQPLVKLMPVELDNRPRVGGQWAGMMVIPSGDELEAIDKEIEASFGASTIFPDGPV